MKEGWKRQWLCAAAFVCFALVAAAAPAPALAEKARKFAIILPGYARDMDFNFRGYQVAKHLEKRFGMKTSYTEFVSPARAERVARGYAAAGYAIVAFHGGEYVPVVLRIAPRFPGVVFIMESSGKFDVPANVWNIHRHYYEGFYPLGVLAGLATKTNKVGVIAGIHLKDFNLSINVVSEALRATNPDAKLVYTFTGDQGDRYKARRAADAMIAEGVDFIVSLLNLGVHGIIAAAKEAKHKVLVTSLSTDKSLNAPRRLAATLLLDFRPSYTKAVRGILRGSSTGYVAMRPGSGCEIGFLGNVEEGVAARVREVFGKVRDGSIKLRAEPGEIRMAQEMRLAQ